MPPEGLSGGARLYTHRYVQLTTGSDTARATGKSEAVYERLRQDIESLRLKPGAKLSEIQLGEELGASRTPVREAIRQLSREGLVDFVPG